MDKLDLNVFYQLKDIHDLFSDRASLIAMSVYMTIVSTKKIILCQESLNYDYAFKTI